MRELSFVGLSADGRNLLLVAPDASEYSLRVDDRLATALRRESDRLRGQPADLGPMPTNPSPREIQDRVRAGMSVSAIAAAAGVSESAVARFATAVLAERAFVAQQACQALVRFQDANIELQTAVRVRLQAAGLDVTAVRWDSWRRPDGDWTVICAYPFNQGERVATFVYDPTSRRAAPDDDEARWILESPTAKTEAIEIQQATPIARTATSQAAPTTAPTPRSWDPNHPAARAHQRREQNAARPTPVSQPGVPQPGSDNPPRSEDAPAPRWEDLLLGSSGDFEDGPRG